MNFLAQHETVLLNLAWSNQRSVRSGKRKKKFKLPTTQSISEHNPLLSILSANICKDELKWCSQRPWKGSRAACRLYSHACFYHIYRRWRFVGTAGKLLPGWFCLVNPKARIFFASNKKTCSTKQPRIQVEKHMIVTATTEVYIATAFEPWFYLVVFVAAVPMFVFWTWGVVQWIPTTFRFCLWSMRAFGKNVGREMGSTNR